jgi:hypothetical protein
MIRTLRLALLMNVCTMSVASAQPAPSSAEDFSGLGHGRTITVVSDDGRTTTARLLRFTPETLAVAIEGREVVFERNHVARIVEHGDSVRNGMKIGAIAAGSFGVLVGIGAAAWASEDQVLVAAIPVAIFGLVGAGIGAGIDGLITGHRQLYERTPGARVEGGPEDFSGLSSGRAVTVVEDSGVSNTGRLRRVTPDTVTMTLAGGERTFTRQHVTAIFERGDPVKNGGAIGLLTGAAIGFTAGASKTTCGRNDVGFGLISAYLSHSPCTASERIGQGLREGALLGVFGAGLGVVVDALIPGQRILYESPKQKSGTAIAIAPSLGPSRIGFLTSVSW